jgi:tRNA(Ile)-lysidine synthase
MSAEQQTSFLLAVSGGVDSMVMAHLFVKSEYRFAIAHCNFSLRGEESDADEVFVKTFAASYDIPFYSTRFDTAAYAAEKNISIQLAARELRYSWFEKLRQELGYDKVAVAHNSNDSLETFFINLSRGAGLNGLTGIPTVTESLIRPLLAYSREGIVEYARVHNVPYREDLSNRSDKYLRNKLRHHVLPVLDDISPSFRAKASESISYLAKANQFIEMETKLFLQRNSAAKGEDTYLSLDAIRQFHSRETLLFYILKTYGFRRDVIAGINGCIDSVACGKRFFSSTHCLLIDRSHIIISPAVETRSSYALDIDAHIHAGTLEVRCEVVEKTEDFQLLHDKNVGEFDLSKLNFPLFLRNCQDGDRFVPLGMTGQKKLSDFFIDIKLPVVEKRRRLVLVSGDDIVWLVGLRPDERFKVTDLTEKVLRVRVLPLLSSNE